MKHYLAKFGQWLVERYSTEQFITFHTKYGRLPKQDPKKNRDSKARAMALAAWSNPNNKVTQEQWDEFRKTFSLIGKKNG